MIGTPNVKLSRRLFHPQYPSGTASSTAVSTPAGNFTAHMKFTPLISNPKAISSMSALDMEYSLPNEASTHEDSSLSSSQVYPCRVFFRHGYELSYLVLVVINLRERELRPAGAVYTAVRQAGHRHRAGGGEMDGGDVERSRLRGRPGLEPIVDEQVGIYG
nr:hypothetical protein Iba_chr13bCG1730 [Ipomoea batatas]